MMRVNWLRTILLLTLPLFGLTAISGRAQAQLRIMPFGDSITEGHRVPGGYRIRLWEHLVTLGLDFEFVGSLENGPKKLGSRQHEGHSSFDMVGLTTKLDTWLDSAQPDIILLHAGVNDCFQDIPMEVVIGRLSALIDQITDRRPNSLLIVSTITPTAKDPIYDGRVPEYNKLIPGLLAAKLEEGRWVGFADMASAGVTLIDGVHPDRA